MDVDLLQDMGNALDDNYSIDMDFDNVNWCNSLFIELTLDLSIKKKNLISCLVVKGKPILVLERNLVSIKIVNVASQNWREYVIVEDKRVWKCFKG